jgi:hypothetical protein
MRPSDLFALSLGGKEVYFRFASAGVAFQMTWLLSQFSFSLPSWKKSTSDNEINVAQRHFGTKSKRIPSRLKNL